MSIFKLDFTVGPGKCVLFHELKFPRSQSYTKPRLNGREFYDESEEEEIARVFNPGT